MQSKSLPSYTEAMKYILVGFIGFILSASVFAIPVEYDDVLIVEMQTGSPESASQEFVELYNPNDSEIDITGWLLQYKSATGENWSTKSELSGVIEPRGRYLVSTVDYLDTEALDTMSSGLAKTAGHIRLLEPTLEEDGEDVIHDVLGWGLTADSAEGELPTVAPEAGQSLKRLVDEDGYFIDTDVNVDDFETSELPTPVSDEEPAEEVVDVPEEDVFDEDTEVTEETDPEEVVEEPADETNEEQGEVAGIVSEPKVYAKVQITELFIDPSSPKTDADDEFIELFNPNKESVQLEGYVIQTGNTFSRSFTIPTLVIHPGQYLALYSIDTGIPLSNAGSQARILDPNGNEVYKTSPYEKAKSDNAWALVAGKWQWTSNPTPAAPNVIIVPASTSRKKSSKNSSKSRKSSSRSSNSSSSSGSDARIIYEEPAAIVDTEINVAVLVGVGSMAIGYAMYEYRHDIANRYHQSRRYFKSRR